MVSQVAQFAGNLTSSNGLVHLTHAAVSKPSHDYCLEQLIANLERVGEDLAGIAWISSDETWWNNGIQQRLCDLVVMYADMSVSLLELKGSRKKKDTASLQLESSEQFVKLCFPDLYKGITKKIVYYVQGDNDAGHNYEYEVLGKDVNNAAFFTNVLKKSPGHDTYVSDLSSHLYNVGERRIGFRWFMRDLRVVNGERIERLCDLAVSYDDGRLCFMELVGSNSKLPRASAQLDLCEQFANKYFNGTFSVLVKKVVVWDGNGNYTYREIPSILQ